MSTFPTLAPNSISVSHGEPQISEYQGFGIGPIRFRHNNFINKQGFTFTYRGLEQASVELLRTHYRTNNGTADRFSVPIALFGGLNVVTSNSVFRYTETPTEEHIGVKLYNVSVSIEAVEGIELLYVLDGGPATLPSEETANAFAFVGTAPFILDGTDSSQATLILNGD